MKNFFHIFKRWGYRVYRTRPQEELSSLAQLSRHTFREPVEWEPLGKKFDILLMDDLDPKTNRLYPDYLERRKRRKEEEKEARCAGVYDNWKPGNM